MSYQAAGWQGYKIHPFRIWRDDMRICRAVREAVGDGFPLMLDSTWGYDYPQALRVGKLIEELDFAPGLGVEIDFDLIERNKTAELR